MLLNCQLRKNRNGIFKLLYETDHKTSRKLFILQKKVTHLKKNINFQTIRYTYLSEKRCINLLWCGGSFLNQP